MKQALKFFLSITILGILLLFFINSYVKNIGEKNLYQNIIDLPKQQTALILGAKVYDDGSISDMLLD
ncbi:hypothetical protein K8R66_02930, partial [bacterium]|nr:hypothetical protein [bacterium]